MSLPTEALTLNRSPATSPWTNLDWLLLAVVTVLGAVLRFYKLGVVPPGFQFDEAFNAIDASQVLHGNFPLFLPANGGREVLYTYFQAGLGALFGFNIYTLRLASALLGTAAVPATYLLLRHILHRQSRKIALFTSLSLAVSLWHLHFSHYGIRVITMPVLFSALFGCYWLGVHGSHRRTRLWGFIASGVLTGLSVWTNPTGRLVPFVLILFTVWLLWRVPKYRCWRLDAPLGGLLLTGAVALMFFLPLGLEFYRHPEWFTGHAAEVSIFAERVSGGNPWWMLARNVGRVLGMFSFVGDGEWIHGPAGRPVFDPLLSIPFVLGVALWLRRLMRIEDDADGAALALLACWTVVMLVPSVFSDAAPNYSRTLPALPAVLLAVGLGLTWLGDQIKRILAVRLGRTGGVIALLIPLSLVAISGVIAFYDYFVRFPSQPETYYTYEANKLDAVAYWAGLAEQYEIYLHPLWADHPPVRVARSSKEIKALDTAATLVLPPTGKGVLYAYPPERIEQAVAVAALWPGVQVETLPDKFDTILLAQVKVEAMQLSGWPPVYQPTSVLEARFEDAPTLLGMQTVPNEQEISLFWRGEERQTVRNLTAFIHLIDADGHRVGQIDQLPGNGSYQTPVWSPGERVIERYAPEISDPCAGGEEVQVQVGWYELAAGGARRPRLDAPGDTALAGALRLPIMAQPPDRIALPNAVNLAVTDDVTLLAYAVRSVDVQAGAPLVVDLYLQAGAADAEQLITLWLERAGGSDILWQAGVAPGATWPADEVICRRVRTHLPNDAVAGEARLALALNEVRIGFHELTIGASTRHFIVPPSSNPVEATLGHAVKLLGSDFAQPTTVIANLDVTLVWQALTVPERSYTVFVHLLNEAGIIVAQSDALPAGGYTTERWVAGEVVSDTHSLILPDDPNAGVYRLFAGLYDSVSGERLPVTDRNGQPVPDDAVLLGEMRLP